MGIVEQEKANPWLGLDSNLFETVKNSKKAFEGFNHYLDSFYSNTLKLEEKIIILMTVSFENASNYSMSYLTYLAKNKYVNTNLIFDLREDNELKDSKLQSLRVLVKEVTRSRGYANEEVLHNFSQAGYGYGDVVDILQGISISIFLNYLERMFGVELDDFLDKERWEYPVKHQELEV